MVEIYRGSGDGTVFGITAVVVTILLVVAVFMGRSGFAAEGAQRVMLLGIAAFCVSLVVFAWAFAPSGYRVTEDQIVIDRPLGGVEIPISTIREVVARDGLRGAIRTFGTGGLFGIYGRYYHEELGGYRMYGTRLGSVVVIQTDEGTFVLTPDDGPGFVATVESRRAVHDAS